jgi:hypothetical protein
MALPSAPDSPLQHSLKRFAADVIFDDPQLAEQETADGLKEVRFDACVRARKPFEPKILSRIEVQLIALEVDRNIEC